MMPWKLDGMNFYGQPRGSHRGLGACHQQGKKGAKSPLLHGSFFGTLISVSILACTKTIPNDPKRPRTKTGKKRVTKPKKGGDKTL